jgi:hypothetical protein
VITQRTQEMQVRVERTADGRGLVEVNGVDVTRGVTGASMELAPNKPTRVWLSMAVVDGAQFSGSAHVGVATPTAELLIKLGWTPPTEEAAQ